ncbi:MAG: hypothetical protein HC786_28695 [Richelia sp. CSU_2_1]|nr:hypothetical protein [Richelia sp. CSU_2_1]
MTYVQTLSVGLAVRTLLLYVVRQTICISPIEASHCPNSGSKKGRSVAVASCLA